MRYSIIIRTKNEEAWIGRCLKSVFNQSEKDIEVIIVDSGSNDETISIAQEFPIAKVIQIGRFLPGEALNIGIKEATGKYVVALSAHCVPVTQTWLQELHDAVEFDSQEEIVAAYGRQIPIETSSPVDKRDLMNTFGLDFLVQDKDFFFHNANSIVRREYLLSFPYNDTVTNVEDRIWAKDVIDRGHKIAYTPEALVYHHHGLNHDNDELRLQKVTSLIEPLYQTREAEETLGPTSTTTIIIASISSLENLTLCLSQVLNSDIAKEVFVISEYLPKESLDTVRFIKRDSISGIDFMSIPSIIQYVRNVIQERNERTEYYIFLYPKIINRPDKFLLTILKKAEDNFLDVCFPARQTFKNLWTKSPAGDYKPVETNLSLKHNREPQYEAYFNLGLIMSNHAARLGNLSVGHTGILEINFEPEVLEL